MHKTYEKIKSRHIIERIGYDVSVEDIKNRAKQRFVFDTHAIEEMIKNAEMSSKVLFIVSASSQKSIEKSQSISWSDSKRVNRPSLVINNIRPVAV